MPQTEATKKWCEEARRILTLASAARATPEKALEKSLVDRHKELAEKLAALNSMVELDASVIVELDHEQSLVRSQIHVGNFALAAESLQAFDEKLLALAATHKANAAAAVTKASRIAEEERLTLKFKLSEQLKEAGGAAPNPQQIQALRKLAEEEFRRDAQLADLLKQAGALKLDLPPPPARTGFDDNKTPSATHWNAAICEAAFSTYTWFDFKAFRKQGDAASFRVPGLDAQHCKITDDVMWLLYQFRRKVIDGLVKQLHDKHPGQLLFSSNGSEDIESDLDITVASPHSGVDVEAMSFFNKAIKARFGRPPGRVFDTNLYARDYNAIKTDNISKKDAAPAPADHAIAEPGGAMQKMANIDQDVATLMKQRRFMDAESFTAMWEGLRERMAPQDRAAIEQRFEEGEAAYLLTALEKVDAIEKKIKASMKDFDEDAYAAKYGPERAKEKSDAVEAFAQMSFRYGRAKKAHASGKSGGDNAKAVLEIQQMQDELLDFMEAHFEDEVMEATDEIYAQRMEALRDDQLLIQAKELSLAGASTMSEEERAKVEAELASAKARAKQAQFTNIVFANEAYVSQGAITHVVSGKQAGDASVLEKITPAELMQSGNEQLADFLKDMKHMEHGVPEAEDGNAENARKRRQATGEAFVHASKYLARMLEAVAMLEAKYRIQFAKEGEAGQLALAQLTRPYPLVTQAGAKSAKELQTLVEGHLLKLRKSSSIPGDVKAEMAVAEAMSLFNTPTIPALRSKIQGFCVEFNQRVRSLDDFRKSQQVDDKTFRQYFDPAAV